MSRMSLGQLCSLGCLVALHLPRLHCPGFLPRCHFPAFVQLAASGELHPHLRLGTFAHGDPSSQDPFPPVHKPVLVLPGPAQGHLLYKSPSTPPLCGIPAPFRPVGSFPQSQSWDRAVHRASFVLGAAPRVPTAASDSKCPRWNWLAPLPPA